MIELFKKYKWEVVISNIIILIPLIVLILSGNMQFISFPIIMLAVHWLTMLLTLYDNKNRRQSKKVIGLLFWIVPAITLFTYAFIYARLSYNFLIAFIGLIFIIIGNYMPKLRQNKTVGIKVKWTLENEENWTVTHRFSSRVFIIGGFILLADFIFPDNLKSHVMIITILLTAFIPVLYSYLYYKGQVKRGEYKVNEVIKEPSKRQKIISYISLAIAIIIVVFVGILLFTGDIEVDIKEDYAHIKASYYVDMNIDYDEIDSIELRETYDKGVRTNGFGSFKLSMGTFSNDEFGSYSLYTYNKTDECIVLKKGDSVLVLGGKDKEETESLYRELKKRI